MRLRDDEVRRNRAVGVPAHRQLLGISNSLSQNIIHSRHVVFIIPVTPVRKNCFAELLAVPGGSSWIRLNHQITIRRENLSAKIKFSLMTERRAAVQPQDGRILDRKSTR